MSYPLNERELQKFFSQGDNEVYAFNLLINQNYKIERDDRENFRKLFTEVRESNESSIYIASAGVGLVGFLYGVRRVKAFSCPYLTAGCAVFAFLLPPAFLRSLNKQYYARNFRLMRDISRRYDWKNDTTALRKLEKILSPVK